MPDCLSAWRAEFFNTRPDLASRRPDGRALYGYRLTDEEFQSLERALRQKLSVHSSLDFLARHNSDFSSLFVLYAAGWWRRRYQGTKWRWQPILHDLGVRDEQWSPGERGECVERGLRYWCLDRTHDGGLRYMKAITLQAGLPMALLAAAKGKLGQILGRVLDLAKTGSHGTATVRAWIDSLAGDLPKAYQEEVIYDLLADLVVTILGLVRAAQLTTSADAIASLDRHRTDWRDRLPLPVGDREAQGLIEQLIRDAAMPAVSTPAGLVVRRWLEEGGEGEIFWTLRSNMELPDKLRNEDIRQYFNGDDALLQGLGRAPTLRLEVSGHAITWPLQRLAGHDAYRVQRHLRALGEEAAAAEHRLLLCAADGETWPAPARRGEALAPELPWLFEEDEGRPPRWVRQGGGGMRSEWGIVAVAEGWSVEPKERAKLVAYLEHPLREIYRVQGQITITGSGGRWQVRTAQADADEAELYWRGDAVWEGFINPPSGFRGRPTLYDGERKVPDHALTWQSANHLLGPVTAIWREHDEERHRARLVILPPEATVHIRPVGPQGGDICLERWQAVGARLAMDQPVTLEVVRNTDALVLHCTSRSEAADRNLPPEWVEVELFWPANPSPARIRFPFPAQGVRAFDGQGRALANESWLPLHRLTGVRLAALGITSRLELRLTLRRPKEPLQEGFEIRHPIQWPVGASRVEIRLQDFAESIERLLSADDLLDAWVKTTVWGNHNELFTLRLSRYLCSLERVPPDVHLTQEGLRRIDPAALANLQVLALRLESPGDEPIRLEPCLSEGRPTGAWAFATAEREPGSWFIYPGAEAQERFRPTLWTLPGEHPAISPLTQALAVEQRHERTATLDEVIAVMAADYQESCWPDLERLAGHLGHLPLSSLDLWRRFAHSPAGMAALALRMNNLPEGFVRRFAVELPFAWELVPYRVWLEAIRRLRRQCQGWFGEDAGKNEMQKALDAALDTMRQECQALSKLLGVLRSVALGEPCREVEMMRQPTSDPIFREQMFGREHSALQRLLRNRADDNWPPSDNDIFDLVEAGRSSSGPGSTLFTQHPGSRDGLINLPILLAIQTAAGVAEEWFDHPERIHWLRTYRAFDPEWFEEAFDLTIARCLSQGLLNP